MPWCLKQEDTFVFPQVKALWKGSIVIFSKAKCNLWSIQNTGKTPSWPPAKKTTTKPNWQNQIQERKKESPQTETKLDIGSTSTAATPPEAGREPALVSTALSLTTPLKRQGNIQFHFHFHSIQLWANGRRRLVRRWSFFSLPVPFSLSGLTNGGCYTNV